MNSPPSQTPADRRALRDLMPSIYVEICLAALFWAAYFCRKTRGFDPLYIFHKGGPAPAPYYLWCAIIFTVIAIWAVTFKVRRARILQLRGIETTGTIMNTSRRARNLGWDVKLSYRIDAKEVVVTRICETKSRPTDGSTVPVVYDPQRPDRSWVQFVSRK